MEHRLLVPGSTGRENLDTYVEREGYLGLARALQTEPFVVRRIVAAAGLRGRGGSGRSEPASPKWELVAGARDSLRFVVANGFESHPESSKDRLLMERYPHRILEGLLIACHAVGARQAFLYIKESNTAALRSMKKALPEARQAGAWGDYPVEVMVYEAPEGYIEGEETALIDAIEGHRRPRPRLKPPTPAEVGLFGHPTLVQNVETLANLPFILREGPEAYRTVGTPELPGTCLVNLAGAVRRPGVYEVPYGISFLRLIEEYGGGAVNGGVAAVLPGGLAGAPLLAGELETPLDPLLLLRLGAPLYSGVVVVIPEPWDPVATAAATTEYFAERSCRQCELCQEGTHRLRTLAQRLASHQGEGGEVEQMQAWARRLRGQGNCLHATNASLSATRWLRTLPGAFRRAEAAGRAAE